MKHTGRFYFLKLIHFTEILPFGNYIDLMIEFEFRNKRLSQFKATLNSELCSSIFRLHCKNNLCIREFINEALRN